jgi:hypothetical protein
MRLSRLTLLRRQASEFSSSCCFRVIDSTTLLTSSLRPFVIYLDILRRTDCEDLFIEWGAETGSTAVIDAGNAENSLSR